MRSWQTSVKEFVNLVLIFYSWTRMRRCMFTVPHLSNTEHTVLSRVFLIWIHSEQQWKCSPCCQIWKLPLSISVSVCLCVWLCVCLLTCVFLHAFNSQHAQALHPIPLHSGSALLHPATIMTVTSPSILSPPKQQLQHLLLIVCSGCPLTSLLFFSSAHPAIKV